MGYITPFTRKLDETLIAKLKKHDLFKNHLLNDIRPIGKQELIEQKEKNNEKRTRLSYHRVFPAIRNNRVDFYFCGNKLFSFDEMGFSTHIKYASVLEFKGKYVNEDKYNGDGIKKPISFAAAYERIKENCSLYAGVESAQLADLLDNYSFAGYKEGKAGVIVLDIEAQFGRGRDDARPVKQGNRQKQDRIDLLLYSPLKRKLKFIEAKHFSNKELRSIDGDKLEVRKQLKRYDTQINDTGRKTQIITAYNDYIKSMNKLFDLSLPGVHTDPEEGLEKRTGLIIYGFDGAQQASFQDSFMTEKSVDLPKCRSQRYGNLYEDIPLYLIGDSKGLDADTIWNKTRIIK